MSSLSITQNGPASFRIEGLPDAVKVIALDSPKARELANLTLHRSDLTFALECLETMDRLPGGEEFIRRALWRSAVVHYAKCFGSSARRLRLDPREVYKGCPTETHLAFKWVKSLRNKHVIHDENAYNQSAVGAALNAGNKPFKVERVVALALTFEVHGAENVRNVRLLVLRALEWVGLQVDECCNSIKAELEKVPYDELAARPALQTTTPNRG
jgi:uncharacterized protein with HEPN domain